MPCVKRMTENTMFNRRITTKINNDHKTLQGNLKTAKVKRNYDNGLIHTHQLQQIVNYDKKKKKRRKMLVYRILDQLFE